MPPVARDLTFRRPALSCLFGLVAALPVVSLADGAAASDGFQACLARLEAQALERALDPELVRSVVPRLAHLDRVLELDRRQPEFMQTFARYLSLRVNDARIDRGRRLLAEHRELLDRLQQTYGVPGHYLVAFWGLETNFGGYLGDLPTLDALATLACDERRAEFFTGEFLIALELMERERLRADDMQGSWAGAMGQTQFMPSTYLRYAVDGDGDGRIDLWGSPADALASGAHFLARLGWERGLRWGREVLLPEDFDYALAGGQTRQPLRAWADLGITASDGGRLPAVEVEAALLVPSGAEGPAFLVYRNFDVIMGWNRSEAYALSVGLLADRIAGAPELRRSPPRTDALRIADVERLQRALADAGFDPGPVDGIWGPASRRALSDWERSRGRVADGFPDAQAVAELLGEGS